MPIIYLGLRSRPGSINLPAGVGRAALSWASEPARRTGIFGLSTRKVYRCPRRCRPGGRLLPYLFTLTHPKAGGYFLWHWL